MSSFQLALSADDTAALGGFIKELSQSPLFSDRWSQADFIDWRITLTDNRESLFLLLLLGKRWVGV